MEALREEHSQEVESLKQDISALSKMALAVHRQFLEVKRAYEVLRRHVGGVSGDVETIVAVTQAKVRTEEVY